MAVKTMLAAVAVSLMAVGAAYADCSLPADAQNGKAISNQCKTCHIFEADKSSANSFGPNLHDVFGERAATRKDYPNYSAAMIAANVKGLTWNEARLLDYLFDPKAFLAAVTGNPDLKHGMFFSVKDEQKRKDVVAFLKAIKGKPECN